jgi:hypothetical protein
MKKILSLFMTLVAILTLNTLVNADFKSEFDELKNEYNQIRTAVTKAKSTDDLINLDNKIVSLQLKLENFGSKYSDHLKINRTNRYLYDNMKTQLEKLTDKISELLYVPKKIEATPKIETTQSYSK